jgi:hypothetical protein
LKSYDIFASKTKRTLREFCNGADVTADAFEKFWNASIEVAKAAKRFSVRFPVLKVFKMEACDLEENGLVEVQAFYCIPCGLVTGKVEQSRRQCHKCGKSTATKLLAVMGTPRNRLQSAFVIDYGNDPAVAGSFWFGIK